MIFAACFSASAANARPRALELLDLLLGRGLDVVVSGVGERVASRVAADDGTTAAGLDGGGHVAAAAEGAGLHDLRGWRPVGGADQLRVACGQRAARRHGQGGDAEQDRRRRQSADQRLARSSPPADCRSARRVDDGPLLGAVSTDGLATRVACAWRGPVWRRSCARHVCRAARRGTGGSAGSPVCGRARRACPHGVNPWTLAPLGRAQNDPDTQNAGTELLRISGTGHPSSGRAKLLVAPGRGRPLQLPRALLPSTPRSPGRRSASTGRHCSTRQRWTTPSITTTAPPR